LGGFRIYSARLISFSVFCSSFSVQFSLFHFPQAKLLRNEIVKTNTQNKQTQKLNAQGEITTEIDVDPD
jgi:hypothetical protein